MTSISKLLFVLAAVSLSPVETHAVSPQEEYGKLVNGGESVAAYDGGLFGDSMTMSTGSVEFKATDVALPGNNAIPVSFGRRRSVEIGREPNFMLGDWDIDIPFIEGIYSSSQGWLVDTAQPFQRCSSPQSAQQGAPPAANAGGIIVQPREFWLGVHLQTPGGGRQELLRRNVNVAAPTDGAAYPYVTSGLWNLSCAPTLASGQAGEGFRAKSPDGMTYTFNWMVSSPYPAALVPHALGGNAQLTRSRVRLYPTAIQDRHGNVVNYNWLGDKLQSITSNDGRALTVQYVANRISSVTDNSTPQRVWSYSYLGSQLQYVNLPDGSRWTLDFAIGIGAINYDTNTNTVGYDQALGCNWMRKLLFNERLVEITHPSGALGKFKFDVKRHGRSNVDSLCIRNELAPDPRTNYPTTPARFDTWSLVAKSIEGPGLPAAPFLWSYNYVLPVGNFRQRICGQTCPPVEPSKFIKAVAPDGSLSVHTYGIKYATTDGQLQSIRTYRGSNEDTADLLRSEAFGYVLDGQATPFPDRIGSTMQTYSDDSYFGERMRPQNLRSVTQGGVTFSSTTTAFDEWANPATVAKSSALGSKTEISVYSHNLSKWVLGQLHTLTVDGKVQTRIDYDPINALPIATYAFGKLQQTIDYYDAAGQDGTIRSITDGNSRETIFTNYFRGIARHVAFPTGASQSATVNNYGSITSITDELGNVRNYDYYSDGRLWKIRYPTGDSPAWNEQVLSFQQVGSSEYGVGGGHWKQTVTHGTATKVTIYDALWRPVLIHEQDTAAASTSRFTVRRHDFGGRETFVSYPRASVSSVNLVTTGTSSSYDALGRLIATAQTSELGNLGTSVTYLPTNFQKRVQNARGKLTTFTFQAFDEPKEDAPVLITAPETSVIEIDRDEFGKPRSITRRGTQLNNGSPLVVSATRSYVYDTLQQLCKTIEPEIGATVMDYDGAGNIAWTAAGLNLPSTSLCDRGAAGVAALRSDRSYDELNRPLNTTFADGSPAIRRLYWPDGQLKEIRTVGTVPADNTAWNYGYNNRRLPTSEVLSLDARTYALENRYSSNGHLKALVYPDLVEVDYAPNALGEPTKAGNAIRNYASGVTTWPSGAIKDFSYGNNVAHSMTQNARGLPMRSLDSMGVLDDTYSYDANANVSSIADAVSGATRSMQYDDLDRLETMTAGAPWSNSSYQYDAIDNVRASTVGSRVYTHSYTAANLLEALKVGGVTQVGYNYLRGNLTQRGNQTFIFDQANRLVSKSGESPKIDERYAYDGHGRRVKVVRTLGGETRHMVYSQSGQLRFETNLETGKFTDYIYLGGTLVAREESGVAGPPAAPVVTAPASNSTGSYAVTWTTPSGASNYVLEENRNAAGWVGRYSGTATSTTLTLRSNGTYQYRAKACNSSCSGWSAVVTTVVTNVSQPPTPSSIAVNPLTSRTGNFEVRWRPVAGATLYRLYENPNASGWQAAPFYTGPAPATFVTGKANGSYQYRVEACTSACSLPSVAVTATVAINANVPAAPTLSVPPSSTGAFTVTWTSVTGALQYQLEELNPDNWFFVEAYYGPFTSLARNKPPGTYHYRVRSCINGQCGDASAAATIVVATGVIPPPPASLTANPTSSTVGTTTLTWPASNFATRYVLERSSLGGPWTVIHDDPGRTRTDTNLAVGQHAYRVKACATLAEPSCSGWRGPVVFERTPTGPVAPPPVASVSVSPTSSSNGAYTLSWVPGTGGTVPAFFLVWESLDGGVAGCANPCSVAAPATSLSFSGRGTGEYRHWVQACVPGACSALSPVVTVTVAIPGAPTTPSFISTTATGCTASPRNISLSWGTSQGASRYEILQENSLSGAQTTHQMPGTNTSGTVTTSIPGNLQTDFSYRVRGCNASTPSQCSEWRGEVSVCVGTSTRGGGRGGETTVRYLHTDALGSPVAETDEIGAVLKRTRYEAYGAPTDGIYTDGPGYTGHVTDSASGLTYMQQRYYDPLAARFLSLDPVTTDWNTGVGFNRYAYANNNPYKFVDPDGRIGIVGFLIGAAIEATVQVSGSIASGQGFGEAVSNIDVGDVLAAGAISAIIPGLGSVAKAGYQGTKSVTSAVKAIDKISKKTANTPNRAAKNAAGVARNYEKAEKAVGEVGIAAGAAAVHQLVKAEAKSQAPQVTVAEVKKELSEKPLSTESERLE